MKDDAVYIQHILQCIARIEAYTALGETAFQASLLQQDAVLRNLQTLAESTQRLSTARKEMIPDIPWELIAGFRNVLVHDYLGIDLEVIWRIIQEDIPPLKQAVATMSTDAEAPDSRSEAN